MTFDEVWQIYVAMLPTSQSSYRTFHYLPNISHSFQSISSPQLQPLTMAVLFFVSIDILEYHKIKSYSMWYSAPGFFHLAQCFWDSSILLHVLVVFVFVFVFGPWVLIHYIDIPQFFIYLKVDEYLGYLQLLVIVNEASMNIHV